MPQPNIIFILSDQHNPRFMGSAPSSIVRTPNLDRLCEEGVSFTNCYCPSPVCVPSRACLLTSTYPQDLGMLLNDHVMPSGWPTVAHSLGVAGYESVLVGRMHFLGPDQRHGFEKRLVGDFTWQYPGGREKNHDMRWKDSEGFTYGPNRQSVRVSGGGRTCAQRFDDAVRDAAIEYIKTRTDRRPLFMTVGFFAPHNPFIGPKEYFDYYYDRIDPKAASPESLKALHASTRTQINLMGLDGMTDEEVRRCTAAYMAMIEKLDDDIGQVLQAVEQTLDMDNTIILYASDHGEMMGDKGMFYKFAMYDGSATVPMIFKWKDHFKAGTTMKNIANIVDIPPTLIEIAGGPQLPLTRGISLYRNMLSGEDIDPERTTCSQIAWGKLIFSGKQYQLKSVETNYQNGGSFGADEPKDCLNAMIRWRNYKLIMHGLAEDEDYELFDLQEDPAERVNIAMRPENREICQRMAAMLLKVWEPDRALAAILRDKAGFNILQDWLTSHDRALDEEVWVPASTERLNYLE